MRLKNRKKEKQKKERKSVEANRSGFPLTNRGWVTFHINSICHLAKDPYNGLSFSVK